MVFLPVCGQMQSGGRGCQKVRCQHVGSERALEAFQSYKRAGAVSISQDPERREVERTLRGYAFDVLENHHTEAAWKTAQLAIFLVEHADDELLAEAQAYVAELRQRKQ